MVSYKLINDRFEIQGGLNPKQYVLDNGVSLSETSSLDNLRDVSPVTENLIVVTSTEGLSIIQVENGNFTVNTLTVKEWSDSFVQYNSPYYFLHESSETSQLESLADSLVNNVFTKGICVYYDKNLGLSVVGSYETFNKYVEPIVLNTLP